MKAEDVLRKAKPLGVCAMLKGTESEEEMLRLFLTVQGMEFCVENQFPDMDIFRLVDPDLAETYGFYIDAGSISLKNKSIVVLVGNTTAHLEYDDPSKRHQVILMHGAKAHIVAQGYAVVFVMGDAGDVKAEAFDNAKIL